MAEINPSSSPDPIHPAPPARPRRKKRWLKVLLAIVVLLIILVLLIPTIASTAMVRSIVVGQVNKNLNGRVEITDWSIGWTGGIDAKGVRVFDDAGAQIAQLDHFSTQLPLTKAIFGKLPLGKVVVDGLSFDAKMEQDGRLNFAKLVKPSNTTTERAPTSSPTTASGSSKLPDISGDIEITNSHGTFQQAGKPTLFVTQVAGSVKIPDINQPITNQLTVGLKVGDGPEGKITTDGSAAAIQNGQVALDTAQIHQMLDIVGVDLHAVLPFVPPTVGLAQLQGVTDAHVAMDVNAGKEATLDATVTGKNMVMAGPMLKGDTLTVNAFSAIIPKATANFPDGLAHWQSGRIKVGADPNTQPISVQFDQGSLTAVADLIPQALLNLKANQKPGAAGHVSVATNLNLGQLAGQLKQTIGLDKDVQVTGGTEKQTIDLTMSPGQANVMATTDIDGITGQRAGKTISLQPIHLAMNASDLGGAGKLPDLRDLKLSLQSVFANADFHGGSVADLGGSLDGDLAKLQSELAQFIDFGDQKLAGLFKVTVNNQGDLTSPGGTAKLYTVATLTNLKLGTDINQPWVQATVVADLHHGENAFVDSAKNVVLTVQTNNAQSPTIDVYATANVDLTGPAKADFKLTRANIDLAKTQAEFGKLIPAGLILASGNASATATGTYDGATKKAAITDATIATNHATIQRQVTGGAAGGQRVDILTDDSLNVKTSAMVDQSAGMNVRIPQLAVTDSSNLLTANVTDAQLLLSKADGSSVSVLDKLQSAKVALDIPDLKRVQSLLDALTPPAPVAPVASADPKAAPVPVALPPLQLTSGSMSLRADISHTGPAMVMNVSELSGKDIAFKRGDAAYQAKPITLQLAANVDTADGKTVMQQIRKVSVSQLSGNLGVATLSMPTPIVITDLSAATPSASGAIKLDGQLADITQLLAAYQAKKADAYPYRGTLSLAENLNSQQGTISVNGSAQVAKFQVMQGNDVAFAEDLLNIANDVSLTNQLNSVAIKNISANMQSSGALKISLQNGTIDDLSAARKMHLSADLEYDLAKLWPIIHPMLVTTGMEDKYKDLKIAGQFKKTVTINGEYPANLPFTEAVKHLTADAGLSVGLFDYNGLVIQNLDVPVALRDGNAITVDGTKPAGQNLPKPAVANDGQLNLGNITIDLTQDTPLVSIPANKALLAHATINPLFADHWLNKFINNPVFVGTKNATGLVDVTVVSCDRLPAGKLVMQQVPQNSGSATIKFSLTDLHIGSEGLGKALGQVMGYLNSSNGKTAVNDSFEANVKDAVVTIAHGVVTQHINFQTGRYNIGFDGNVDLASERLMPLTVNLPGSAVAQIFTHDSNVLNAVPPQVGLIMAGSLTSPQVQWDQEAQKLAKDVAPNIISNLITGGKGKTNGSADNGVPSSQPAAQPNNDPLGGLLNSIQKAQQDKQKKKQQGQQKKPNPQPAPSDLPP